MMGWEKPLMLRHAELICNSTCGGGDILNIGEPLLFQLSSQRLACVQQGPYQQLVCLLPLAGFGLGIIDEAIQVNAGWFGCMGLCQRVFCKCGPWHLVPDRHEVHPLTTTFVISVGFLAPCCAYGHCLLSGSKKCVVISLPDKHA